MKSESGAGPACPLPFSDDELIQLAHGGGGRRMHRLIEGLFVEAFSNPQLDARHDGAVFEVAGQRLAFTTDSYVVDPIFFPGGDIGSLAVNGTVNDLAMCGARPLHLSAGLIIEEGLPTADLQRVVTSMRDRGMPNAPAICSRASAETVSTRSAWRSARRVLSRHSSRERQPGKISRGWFSAMASWKVTTVAIFGATG